MTAPSEYFPVCRGSRKHIFVHTSIPASPHRGASAQGGLLGSIRVPEVTFPQIAKASSPLRAQISGLSNACSTSHNLRIIRRNGDAITGLWAHGMQLSVLGFGCGAVGGLMVRGDAADQERTIARASRPASTTSTPRCSMAMASWKRIWPRFAKAEARQCGRRHQGPRAAERV